VIEIRHELRRVPVVFVDVCRDPADLTRVLRTAIAAGDLRVVVDLGERADASSDVLTSLNRAAKHLRRLGGSLAVVTSQPSLRHLFELTLLSQAFPVFASRDEALRDLR
jgi:anti-anti-sigma regulatory factor